MNISEDRLEEMLERAGDRVLQKIGLDYEGAADDVREIKNFIGMIRIAKKEAMKKITGWIVSISILAFVLGLMYLAGFKLPDTPPLKITEIH